MDFEADDEGDGEETQPGGDDSVIDTEEVTILQTIMNPMVGDLPPIMPKSGDKQGSRHLDNLGFSNSSGKDMDAKGTWSKKKVSMPVKAVSTTEQWTKEDIEVVQQVRYKTDLERFQTYRRNKIDLADQKKINTKDHSAYIEIARADPGSIIKKSIFSIVVYRGVLLGDVTKFDREVDMKFKKSVKGSQCNNWKNTPLQNPPQGFPT